jgi:hypothetical protein
MIYDKNEETHDLNNVTEDCMMQATGMVTGESKGLLGNALLK